MAIIETFTTDTITAAAESEPRTAAPETTEAGGKEGGETLKIPNRGIFTTFGRLITVWFNCLCDMPPELPQSDCNPFEHIGHFDLEKDFDLEREYDHFLDLRNLYNSLTDEQSEMRSTLEAVILRQAFDLIKGIVEEYPVLRPFFDKCKEV